ncbi:hypothetical protein, partial [Haloparvum sedimenti]|uniref:hypothetical protein n=1 Tax=Haloparvum sedimenti TaxID=1678448 RepID=UPI001C4005E4
VLFRAAGSTAVTKIASLVEPAGAFEVVLFRAAGSTADRFLSEEESAGALQTESPTSASPAEKQQPW